MYGTVADCQTYWDARGYAGTASSELLEKASVFVDGLGWRMGPSGVPVPLFPGVPVQDTQEREWPREGAVDVYGRTLSPASVPGAVERATYEAARYESESPGALNAAVRTDQRIVREDFSGVSFRYAEPQSTKMVGVAEATPVVPAVMTVLAPVLAGGVNVYGITGVVA